jgi:hypothetical protein
MGNLNLNDSDSIRAWAAIAPERHAAQLRGLWKLWPQFRDAIEGAMR